MLLQKERADIEADPVISADDARSTSERSSGEESNISRISSSSKAEEETQIAEQQPEPYLPKVTILQVKLFCKARKLSFGVFHSSSLPKRVYKLTLGEGSLNSGM